MTNTGKGEDSSSLGSTILMSSQGYADLVGSQDGKNLYWTTDINTELPIKMGQTGMSSGRPETLSNLFKKAVLEQQDNMAIKVMRDKKELTWTWRQYYNQSMAFAKSLHAIGVDERKAVNIMGFNSPEWAIAYHGSILHNNVVSGVYTTNGPEACHYQAEHSEAQVIVVDTLPQL